MRSELRSRFESSFALTNRVPGEKASTQVVWWSAIALACIERHIARVVAKQLADGPKYFNQRGGVVKSSMLRVLETRNTGNAETCQRCDGKQQFDSVVR